MSADATAALWTFSLVIGVLVVVAAPFAIACHVSRDFAAALDRFVDRVL